MGFPGARTQTTVLPLSYTRDPLLSYFVLFLETGHLVRKYQTWDFNPGNRVMEPAVCTQVHFATMMHAALSAYTSAQRPRPPACAGTDL